MMDWLDAVVETIGFFVWLVMALVLMAFTIITLPLWIIPYVVYKYRNYKSKKK